MIQSLLGRAVLLASLALSVSLSTTACSSDSSGVDNNGKAISDLDIGGDVTLDKGKTEQMSATVKYADGTNLNVTSNPDLVWNIGDTNVATISADGVVTAKSNGATRIKATYQGKESTDHALVVH